MGVGFWASGRARQNMPDDTQTTKHARQNIHDKTCTAKRADVETCRGASLPRGGFYAVGFTRLVTRGGGTRGGYTRWDFMQFNYWV